MVRSSAPFCVINKKKGEYQVEYSELVSTVANELSMDEKSVKSVLDETKKAIINAVKKGEKVKWREFCSFEKKVRPPKKCYNPQTKEDMVSKGSTTLHVKVSSTVKKELS